VNVPVPLSRRYSPVPPFTCQFPEHALQEANSRKIVVPGELAIAGYTDSPSAALVEPALTMVSVPTREIGIQAMKTLAELIRGKKVHPRRRVLDVELVVRESCGSH